MQVNRSAAEMILAYYRVKDSDPEAVDYDQRLDTVTRVCLNQFQSLTYNVHPLVDLFIVLQSQEKDILRLDSIGADEIANVIQENLWFTDSTLRAAISKVTGVDISSGQSPIDEAFVDQFNIDSPNALWFEFRNRNKDK